MNGKDLSEKEEIFSKVLRAGRRTYFFDVRATKADDYYLTITESKKHEDNNGNSYYKKHKVYLNDSVISFIKLFYIKVVPIINLIFGTKN